MEKLRKVGSAIGGAVMAANTIAGLLTWGEDGRIQTFKLGRLSIFDRARWDARRAARAARKRRG